VYTISATSKEWDDFDFDSIMHNGEMEYFNRQRDGFDSLSGEWYISPNEPVPCNFDGEPALFHVILGGTFGNYNRPGASGYTSAECYPLSEVDDFRARLAEIESQPEYLPLYTIVIGDNYDDVYWESADEDMSVTEYESLVSNNDQDPIRLFCDGDLIREFDPRDSEEHEKEND
jgi:hypothetical protein